jgi:hypothetical protein
VSCTQPLNQISVTEPIGHLLLSVAPGSKFFRHGSRSLRRPGSTGANVKGHLFSQGIGRLNDLIHTGKVAVMTNSTVTYSPPTEAVPSTSGVAFVSPSPVATLNERTDWDAVHLRDMPPKLNDFLRSAVAQFNSLESDRESELQKLRTQGNSDVEPLFAIQALLKEIRPSLSNVAYECTHHLDKLISSLDTQNHGNTKVLRRFRERLRDRYGQFFARHKKYSRPMFFFPIFRMSAPLGLVSGWVLSLFVGWTAWLMVLTGSVMFFPWIMHLLVKISYAEFRASELKLR